MHAYTYKHRRTHIHTYKRTYTHTRTHAYIHTYIHKYIHTYTHTHTHTHTCMHTYIHAFANMTYKKHRSPKMHRQSVHWLLWRIYIDPAKKDLCHRCFFAGSMYAWTHAFIHSYVVYHNLYTTTTVSQYVLFIHTCTHTYTHSQILCTQPPLYHNTTYLAYTSSTPHTHAQKCERRAHFWVRRAVRMGRRTDRRHEKLLGK